MVILYLGMRKKLKQNLGIKLKENLGIYLFFSEDWRNNIKFRNMSRFK